MSGCNTDGCIAVKKFVETRNAGAVCSVFDGVDNLNVYIHLGSKELCLEEAQVKELDDGTKQKIADWLKANL